MGLNITHWIYAFVLTPYQLANKGYGKLKMFYLNIYYKDVLMYIKVY